MEGSINDGLSHAKFHDSLNQNLWNKHRRADSTPTSGEYDAALRQALADSGYTKHEADYFANIARQERVDVYGIGDNDFLPRVPER